MGEGQVYGIWREGSRFIGYGGRGRFIGHGERGRFIGYGGREAGLWDTGEGQVYRIWGKGAGL